MLSISGDWSVVPIVFARIKSRVVGSYLSDNAVGEKGDPAARVILDRYKGDPGLPGAPGEPGLSGLEGSPGKRVRVIIRSVSQSVVI